MSNPTAPEPLSPSPEIRRVATQLCGHCGAVIAFEEGAWRCWMHGEDCPENASGHQATQSPEIRYEMRDYHHVHCHSYRPGGACTCWERKEKLIAEWAKREDGEVR